MGALHCALENRVDLYVNEHQKIQHYCARSTEERRIRRIRRKKKKKRHYCARSTEERRIRRIRRKKKKNANRDFLLRAVRT